MTQDVIVSISGLQFVTDAPNADPDPIEVISAASYYYKNGKHYVLFEESDPDLRGKTRNRIKFNDTLLEYARSGAINTRMLFEPGRTNVGFYNTPLGQFMVGLTAGHITISEDPTHIHLKMDYMLDFNQQACAKCALSLDITAREAFSITQ